MTDRTCTVDGCDSPVYGHDLCSKHYQRKRRTGTTDDPPDICKRGLHEFTPENTYVEPSGKRVCRGCRTEHIKQRELPPCKLEGCGKAADGKRGWCGMHYARWRLTGDPGDAEPKRHAPGELWCTVEGCESGDYYAKGLCSLHYQRVWRNGTPDERELCPEFCTVEGCKRPYVAGGLCRLHYLRVWRTGSLDDPTPVTHCAKGHEFTSDNTCVWAGKRYCRTCQAAKSASRRAWMNDPEPLDYGLIVEMYGMVCHLCGREIASMADLHRDHVIPRARGGTHTYDNVRPAHARCNLIKHTKLMSELTWVIRAS